MLACRKQIIDIIKCLVEHGANINKKNKNGETALTITKKKNSSKKTKKKAKKKAKKENIETSELIVKYLEEHITKEVIPCEKINNTKTKDSGLLI